MSGPPLSLPRGHEHPACLVSLATRTAQTFEGWKSSTQMGLHGGHLQPPLCSRHGRWTKVSWAASALMREAQEGRRVARAVGNCSSGPAEPGIWHVRPRSRRPRRKAGDRSEAGGCSKLRGLKDQQVLLTSVPRPHSRVSTSQMEP